MDWLLGIKEMPKYGLSQIDNYYAKICRDEIDTLIAENDIDIFGKRVLDVGMGKGHHTIYLLELEADAYGFDIKERLECSYPRISDRMFSADIRDIPKELLGTFDIAIQYRYVHISGGFHTISKALKPDGIYVVTFVDSEIGKAMVRELRNCFGELKFTKPLFSERGIQVTARKPRIRENGSPQEGKIRKQALPIENPVLS